MALTSLLLDDRRGPLTTDSDPLTLERAVRAALSALDVDPHPRHPAQLPVGTSCMNWEERISQAGAPGPLDRQETCPDPFSSRDA